MNVIADRKAATTPLTKSTGDFCRDPHIVGDTIFRIVMVSTDEIELKVASGFQPNGRPGYLSAICATCVAASCARKPVRR